MTQGWSLRLALALLLVAPLATAQEAPFGTQGTRAERAGQAHAAAAFLSAEHAARARHFWWPTLVIERASTHLRGVRSLDETRFGLSLAYRTRSLGPHLRLLVSPNLGTYHQLAGLAGTGLRIHFSLAGVPFSYGVGASIEARLRDSFWIGYATPLELGTALYRGDSAEHFMFFGVRRSMGGRLINSYLLDPNGYDNENSRDRLLELRRDHPWQVYVSLAFGRRLE